MFRSLALEQDCAAPAYVHNGAIAKFHGIDNTHVKLRERLPSPGHVVVGVGVEILGLLCVAAFTPDVNLGARLIEDDLLVWHELCGVIERTDLLRSDLHPQDRRLIVLRCSSSCLAFL